MLTDAQIDEFRRLPLSFNDMVRAIYEAGRSAQDSAEPAAPAAQSVEASEILLTQADVDRARELLFEVSGSAFLSGSDKESRAALHDKGQLYQMVCEANNLLIGRLATHHPAQPAEAVEALPLDRAVDWYMDGKPITYRDCIKNQCGELALSYAEQIQKLALATAHPTEQPTEYSDEWLLARAKTAILFGGVVYTLPDAWRSLQDAIDASGHGAVYVAQADSAQRDERGEFESHFKYLCFERINTFGCARYLYQAVQDLWEGWQASAALQRKGEAK
jgi:hypothetical protein